MSIKRMIYQLFQYAILYLLVPKEKNNTDMLQPLDIAVFSSFKSIVREEIKKYLFNNYNMEIQTAIDFYLQAWNEVSADVFISHWDIYL